MKKAYIFGSGGHAHVIASIIRKKYSNIFFVDIQPTSGNVLNELDFFNQIERFQKEDIFLGLGDNRIRTKLFSKLATHDITPANCIAEHAFIAHDATLGNGVVICPGAVVGSRAIVYDNCIVNTMSSVDHDCILGENSQLTGCVTFGGTTRVGKNCFFGMKSGTVHNITIGDNVFVMAGSMICHDVPSNVRVGGTPAKIIRKENSNLE